MFRKLMIMALAPVLTLAVMTAGAMAMPIAYGISTFEQSADIQITPNFKDLLEHDNYGRLSARLSDNVVPAGQLELEAGANRFYLQTASAPFLYDANLNSLKLPCIFNRVNALKRVNAFKRVGAAHTLWDKKIGDLCDQWPEGRNITNPGHVTYMPGGLCNRALLRALIRAP